MTVECHAHPTSADGVTVDYLNGLMSEMPMGAAIDAITIVDTKVYGEQMVSTAGRVVVDVHYTKGSPDGLPTRLVVKLSRAVDTIMGPFYANEVAFYRRIRPELSIEAPRCFGGAFDPKTGNFGLILDDLTSRGAVFANTTLRTTPDDARRLLDTLAVVHAAYWQSPRFAHDLSWVQTHLAGDVAHVMNHLAPHHIALEVETENFKREMVQRMRTSPDELLARTQLVQQHQSRLPQTLLHGDTHLGNTYRLADGAAGLLDWQLMVRGYCMHDVHYLITTALSIEDRRSHERDLLAHYLDGLAQAGVTEVPSFDQAWLEFRRALVWGVYIGWLTTPVVNYGWEINVMNHLRLTTAYEDHETARLIDALL